MKISDVKINFLSLGVNECGKPRRKELWCLAEIIYMNGETFTNKIPNLVKKEFRGLLICEEFFVVITTSYFVICNDKGEIVKRLSLMIGEPIACNPDHFICRKDNTITGYNNLGEEIGSRELTADEM